MRSGRLIEGPSVSRAQHKKRGCASLRSPRLIGQLVKPSGTLSCWSSSCFQVGRGVWGIM